MSAKNCQKKASTHTRAIKPVICVCVCEQSERLLGREERECQDFDLILVSCVRAESAFAWQGTAAPKHKLCKKLEPSRLPPASALSPSHTPEASYTTSVRPHKLC